MKEAEIQKQVAIALSESGFVSLKNTTGQAWTGSNVQLDRARRMAMIQNARPIRFGLIQGSSDRIGWKSILITPEMVGKKIAIFAAIECKTAMGRLSEEQIIFLERVSEAGGIAFVARTADDVGRELFKWITAIMK